MIQEKRIQKMQLIEKLNILKFTITSTRLIITSEE